MSFEIKLEEKKKMSEESLKDLRDTSKEFDTYLMKVPEREERKKGAERAYLKK